VVNQASRWYDNPPPAHTRPVPGVRRPSRPKEYGRRGLRPSRGGTPASGHGGSCPSCDGLVGGTAFPRSARIRAQGTVPLPAALGRGDREGRRPRRPKEWHKGLCRSLNGSLEGTAALPFDKARAQRTAPLPQPTAAQRLRSPNTALLAAGVRRTKCGHGGPCPSHDGWPGGPRPLGPEE
jgi:hypothetical protein